VNIPFSTSNRVVGRLGRDEYLKGNNFFLTKTSSRKEQEGEEICSYFSSWTKGDGVRSTRVVVQTHRLPFDRLKPNRGALKSFAFSTRAELVEVWNQSE